MEHLGSSEFGQSYVLQYSTDSFPYDAGAYSTPAIIGSELAALRFGSEPSSAGDAYAEHHASIILSTLVHRGETLEQHGITQDDLDRLVRLNFRHAARNELNRTEKLSSGQGVYPLRDTVDTYLWKAASSPEDIQSTPAEISELDRRVNVARAQHTIEALCNGNWNSQRPLDVELNQKQIDNLKAKIQQLSDYLGMSIEELGMREDEYHAIKATYSPTGFRALMAILKR